VGSRKSEVESRKSADSGIGARGAPPEMHDGARGIRGRHRTDAGRTIPSPPIVRRSTFYSSAHPREPSPLDPRIHDAARSVELTGGILVSLQRCQAAVTAADSSRLLGGCTKRSPSVRSCATCSSASSGYRSERKLIVSLNHSVWC